MSYTPSSRLIKIALKLYLKTLLIGVRDRK